MKKLNKILAIVLAFVMVAALLAGCGPQIPGETNSGDTTPNSTTPGDTTGNGEDDPTPTQTVRDMYASGTTLVMAVGYNSAVTGISFASKTIEDYGVDGVITLADGKSYRVGELKPTWQELCSRLDINIEDKYQGNGSSAEWSYWENQLDQIDIVYGGAATLSAAGLAGNLINIAEYLDYMPNFKAYLDANPVVKLSIVADPTTGAIYYSPYFDGVADIERMPLMRTDWVEKLLNGDGEFTASASNKTAAPVYTPYMPTSGSVTVDVVNAAGTGVEQVTKNYDAYGNIVEKMNAAGSIDGVTAVNMLRDYIDATYGGYYGTNRADLFIGQNAAWDADELVALLRCVVANPQTLNGTNKVYGLFSREDNNNQRKVDMFRFMGTLFGVRGLESRKDYLYVGADGLMHDARQEEDTYLAIERMNALVQEGLVSESFINDEAEKTETMLQNDLGFMHYDYSQTQTIYNEQAGILDEGEMYRPVMVPVARWNDGTGEAYFRFTESWRSVKTDAWALTVAGCGTDQNKIYAALAIIDYAYSKEGQILMSYGPDDFIKTDANGNYVTFSFNGEQWPEIADATREELWSKGKGNYTNYARYFLGSTLSFLKSQSFEYQCTTEAGRLGAGYISTAIGLGVIKHVELEITDNPWYTTVLTTLPIDDVQTNLINTYSELGNSGMFSSSKDKYNLLVDMIINGYSVAPATTAKGVADYVANNWNGSAYLNIQNEAWELALSSYNG